MTLSDFQMVQIINPIMKMNLSGTRLETVNEMLDFEMTFKLCTSK